MILYQSPLERTETPLNFTSPRAIACAAGGGAEVIELIERGFRSDVDLAFAHGDGAAVPRLVDSAYRGVAERPTSA